MIETSIPAWLHLITALFLCHSATARLVNLLPWSNAAKKYHTPLFFAAALSPFLLGFISIAALLLLPGKSHAIHKDAIFGALVIINLIAILLIPKQEKNIIKYTKEPYTKDQRAAVFLIALFIIGLLINSIFIPLTQNDSLEYATTGRIIFDDKTLDNYPPVTPEKYPSGFYGPWTHPPLYIALIYAVELMQDHADSPGLTRLISPWCAILAAGLIFASGLYINRRTGIYAALLFLSTPLLFMGAANALIDPLPILGLALVFTTIFSFSAPPLKGGIIQGSILGLTMWTHSQAMLFPPLMIVALLFYNGFGRWKILAMRIAALISSCFIFALWPYLQNYKKMGSLISDSPLIFTLKELAWNDYFIIGRGIEGITAQIQYGIFKGWFSPESYGLNFWILIFALTFFLSRLQIKQWFKTENNHTDNANPKMILWATVAIVLAYHGGIIISMLLGINQMIRIERYMLIILPFVVFLSGWVLAVFFDSDNGIRRKFACLILSLIAIEFGVLLIQPYYSNSLNLSNIGQPQEKTLQEHPEHRVMAFIRDNTPQDALILAMEASDMYYSNRRMISNLDPRMADFYKSASPQEGFNNLKKIGITNIYIVASAQPTFYNSVLQEIVANPEYTKLVYTSGGSQLYALRNSPLLSKPLNIFDFSTNNISWKKTKYFLVGGRKTLLRILFSSEAAKEGEISKTHLPFGILQRDISTLLQTSKPITVQGNKEYKMAFNMQGHGLLRFWLTQYNKQGVPIKEDGYNSPSRVFLSETILGEKGPDRNFLYRFKTLPDAEYIQIGIEHFGNSSLLVEDAKLILLSPAAPD